MAQQFTPTPATSGQGFLTYRKLDLALTGQVAKNAPGKVFGWHISNANAAVRYVKVYDQATAPDQTATPKLTLLIPAGGIAQISDQIGIDFPTGISLRATTGVADNDTGAPTANDIIANLYYL